MDKDYTASFTVEQSREKVFEAITNVHEWWPEIEGKTDKQGEVFTHHYEDSHRCQIKITELVPGERIVWHVLDNYFSFEKDKNEWKDTDMIFEISNEGDKTRVHFTHKGLVPEYDCFNICSNAWDSVIHGDLRTFIMTK